MWSIRAVVAGFVTVAVALALAACGSSSSSTSTSAALSSSGLQTPETEPLTGGKRGGVLHVLDETDYEHLDPGLSYYTVDYEVVYATQRPLYSYKPNTKTEATPDMAAGPPEISNANKTITVHIKEGIHFSPPVNREVTSEDVAYAIERGANPNVPNPYFHSYFNAIEGAVTADGGPIKVSKLPTSTRSSSTSLNPRRGWSWTRSCCPCRPRSRRNTPKSSTRTSRAITTSTRSRRVLT